MINTFVYRCTRFREFFSVSFKALGELIRIVSKFKRGNYNSFEIRIFRIFHCFQSEWNSRCIHDISESNKSLIYILNIFIRGGTWYFPENVLFTNSPAENGRKRCTKLLFVARKYLKISLDRSRVRCALYFIIFRSVFVDRSFDVVYFYSV